MITFVFIVVGIFFGISCLAFTIVCYLCCCDAGSADRWEEEYERLHATADKPHDGKDTL